MKRPNHTMQGLIFVAVCFLIGALIYQRFAVSDAQNVGNDQETYTMVTEMAGTPDSERWVDNSNAPPPTDDDRPDPGQVADDTDQVADELPTPADSGGNCEARALRRITALGNDEAVMQAGDVMHQVIQYYRNSKSDEASFCAHGGDCYPAHVKEGGRLIKTMELTNCSIQSQTPDPDGDEVMYPVY